MKASIGHHPSCYRHRLIPSMLTHLKVEGHFPDGAAAGVLLCQLLVEHSQQPALLICPAPLRVELQLQGRPQASWYL